MMSGMFFFFHVLLFCSDNAFQMNDFIVSPNIKRALITRTVRPRVLLNPSPVPPNPIGTNSPQRPNTPGVGSPNTFYHMEVIDNLSPRHTAPRRDGSPVCSTPDSTVDDTVADDTDVVQMGTVVRRQTPPQNTGPTSGIQSCSVRRRLR